MTDRQSLLPCNATDLEIALSQAMDRAQELSPGFIDLRGFKFDPTDSIIPFLVAEYGLSEIADYLPDLRQVLKEGIQWQRIIGTPAAVHKSLRWIAHDGLIEENPAQRFKWWWFQVHLQFEVRNTDFVRPMTALAKASKPLRSEFARVTSGWDKRGFRLNAHRLNGGALLNSWSGVRRAPGEPVLSLRVHHRQTVIVDRDTSFRAQQVQYVRHAISTQVAIPRVQSMAIFAANVPTVTNYQNRATVSFQNAPFTNRRFGAPVPRAQIGF